MQGFLMLWHTSCSTHGQPDLPVSFLTKVLACTSQITELSFLRLVFASHNSNPCVHICSSFATEGVKHEIEALSERAY